MKRMPPPPALAVIISKGKGEAKPESKPQMMKSKMQMGEEMHEEEPPREERMEYGDVSPEMVGFRTADETCKTCSRYGKGGTCSLFGWPCDPGDSCGAHRMREDGASDMEEPEEMAAE